MEVECPQCGRRVTTRLQHPVPVAMATCLTCKEVWVVEVEIKVKRVTLFAEYWERKNDDRQHSNDRAE